MKQIEDYIDSRNRLCENCIYGYSTNNKTQKCKLTKQKPDYIFFCENYKIYKKDKSLNKDNIYDSIETKPADKNIFFNKIKYFFAHIFRFITNYFKYVIFIPLEYSFVFYTIFHPNIFTLIISFSLFIPYFYIKKNKIKLFFKIMPNSILGTYYQLPYYFIVLTFYVLEKKRNKPQENLKIIEQDIIVLFSIEYIKYAKFLLTKENRYKIDDKFIKLLHNLDYQYRYIFLSKLTELLIYNNLSNFDNNDIFNKLADQYLKIKNEDKENIKQKYKHLEQQRIEKIQREKEQEKYYYHNFVLRQKTDYYAVLELPSTATKREIKKRFKELALRYHPDRLSLCSATERKQAEEKFKKISEAYNVIRREQGF